MQVLDILLVEDNPGDARLIAEVMREDQLPVQLHHVEDGVEALGFLRRQPPYGAVPRPDLILLDLNMPRMNGWEVLEAIKTDTALKSLPVIVLTTSDAEGDVRRAYAHHANCFLAKPVELDAFIRLVALLKDFWLSAVRLPGR